MAGLAHFVLRHKRIVAIAWLLIFIVGAAASGPTANRMTTDFSLPGQDGYETAKKIAATHGTDVGNPMLLVVSSTDQKRLDDAAVAATFAGVGKDIQGARIVDKTAAGGNPVFSTNDGQTQFGYLFMPELTSFVFEQRDAVIDSLAAHAPPGTTTTFSGLQELSSGGDTSDTESTLLAEVALGALGALAILAFVFASLLALLPLAIAGVAIVTTFLILLGVTYLMDVSIVVQYLVALVGLGVAIDYSLLIVNRWREERDHGHDNAEAVRIAMRTAGHAVVFSGLTVAISLFALVILPVPFLRSIGWGGLLIPLVSVLVSTTLLPVILSTIGPKVDWPKIRHENDASRFWTWWGEKIVKNRVIAALAAFAILGVLIAPIADIRIGQAQSDSLAQSGAAFDAVQKLEAGGVPKGILTPLEVLSSDDASTGVVAKAVGVDGIHTAFGEGGTAGIRDGAQLTMVIPTQEASDARTTKPVSELKDRVEDMSGVTGVAGIGATQIDFIKGVYGNFPVALGIILIVTYILLARAFRSLLLPLKAVILNLASMAATFGLLVLFWQKGYGSEALYDISATGALTFWIPIMVFAFLFGLSMDYEVFILSRMREEWDATKSTSKAVVVGLGRTGRLVTSAALILFFAFFAMSQAPQTDTKLLATALGFGILLDATVIRMLLVPALVSLFGEWNWYMPAGAAKLLRVEPSPRPSRDGDEVAPPLPGGLVTE